jgi:hypothetical protein
MLEDIKSTASALRIICPSQNIILQSLFITKSPLVELSNNNIITMRYSTLAVSCAFGTQLAAANTIAQPSIPNLRGVSTDAVTELLKTSDFSVIDATKWATFLDQPHDVLAAWDPATKHRMFSLLHNVLDFGTGLDKRGLTPAQAKSQINLKKTLFDNEIITDEAKDKSTTTCLHSTVCILCVAAAGSYGIGKIAACATAALSSEALTAPASAGLSTAAVVTGFIECASGPVAVFLTGAIACIEASKRIG